MKNIKLLLLLFIAISCRGQDKKELIQKKISISTLKSFSKQKDRFEIKGYKLFYNDHLLKSDTVRNVFKILGIPSSIDIGTMFYKKIPITLTRKVVYDNPGKPYDQRNYIVDKQGDTLKIIRKYRIHFQQYKARYIADKRDSMLMQIPPLEGSVKVNGFLIDKNTTMDELKQKLRPTIKNADFFVLGVDTVSTWYYGTENDEPLDKFDPRINTKFNSYIRIDYVYTNDKLNAIDYYYDILE